MVTGMEKIELLSNKGKYFKANLHCHTVHSDGHLTPEEIKKYYMEQGYSIVAFTDHRTYGNHSQLNDKNFLALAALEVDINEFGDQVFDFARIKTYHINLYDTNPEENQDIKKNMPLPLRRYYDTAYINQYIDEMHELGFLACYNHPYWSLQNYDDYKDLRGLWAMEIYNYGCEHDGLYGYSPQAYDEMLRSGQRLFCVATDDNHNSYPFGEPFCDSFGGFTMIHAKDLSYASVIEALKAGDFYSSMGPEIYEMTIEGNCLTVKTSPVEKIFVQTQGRRCFRKAVKPGETMTEAKFEITGKEGYLRLDIRDGRGLHANSNAYFLDEIMKRDLQG